MRIPGLENVPYGEWIVAATVFVLVVVLVLVGQPLLWKHLDRVVKSKKSIWGDYLLDALRGPSRLLGFVFAIGLSGQMAPDLLRSHPIFIYGVKVGLILAAFLIAERAIISLVRQRMIDKIDQSGQILVINLIKILIFSIATLAILDTIGISITPLLASLGVGSVAVALALQDTLSNFFSGVYLLADKPIRPGDLVAVDDATTGIVTRIGWRSTQVRNLSNNMVIFPNSKLSSARIVNFEYPDKELGISVDLGVAYGSDLGRVEQITIDVAREVLRKTAGAVSGFEPSLRYTAFADSSVNFSVSLRAQQYTDQFLIKHEFIKSLHERFLNEKIEIPFPQRVVHIHNAESPSNRSSASPF